MGAQADGSVQAVSGLHVHQLHRDVRALDRLGDDYLLRVGGRCLSWHPPRSNPGSSGARRTYGRLACPPAVLILDTPATASYVPGVLLQTFEVHGSGSSNGRGSAARAQPHRVGATLSFLGLSQAGFAERGRLVSPGQAGIVAGHRWASTFPGAMAFPWASLSFNLVGDGLRDMLDPRTEGR